MATANRCLQAAPARPKLTISAGRDHQLRETFLAADKWPLTRSLVGAISFADHVLAKHGDSELRLVFDRMRDWDLQLELEVGAVKEWAATAEKALRIGVGYWDRFQRCGGVISSIAMDEPLSAAYANRRLFSEGLAQTANFIALLRQALPNVRVGDVEPYPGVGFADHQRWISALQARLSEMGVQGLDFYRIDPDWAAFQAHHGTWSEVKALQETCSRKHIPFSLIYWAADYPAKEHNHVATDFTWSESIMREGFDYAAAGGKPDEFVIEDWLRTPAETLPESTPGTFTRSVVDFARAYITPVPNR